MIKKLKVVTVVGTRPEIIRLSRVLNALNTSESIEHILVHTGQNYDYELNEIFFEDLEIQAPDYFLEAAKGSASETVGQILLKITPLLQELQPDAFLVLGDTNSCLCAIPAKKLKVPVFHMEAGNRCFDQRVPEETNRKIVDHVADVNLTYSDIAREYLLREGLPADRIIKTGSPMFEALNHYMPKIDKSDVLTRLGLEYQKYFVVSAHREENITNDTNFKGLLASLNQIAITYGYPIIFSTHPRTRQRLDGEKANVHEKVKFVKPLGFSDYNCLQKNAFAVLSDSGTISEESSIMNFRALNIRDAHERPEAMEEAVVMMVGMKPERIMQGLKQLENQSFTQRNMRLVDDYSMPNVGEKVVRIIISYTSYINRVVWAKSND